LYKDVYIMHITEPTLTRGSTAEQFDLSLLRQLLSIVHRLDPLHDLLEQNVAVVGEDCTLRVVLLECIGGRLTDFDCPVRVGNASLVCK
jgi:hypothetical protein